jgi:glutathione peroxidase-family protein
VDGLELLTCSFHVGNWHSTKSLLLSFQIKVFSYIQVPCQDFQELWTQLLYEVLLWCKNYFKVTMMLFYLGAFSPMPTLYMYTHTHTHTHTNTYIGGEKTKEHKELCRGKECSHFPLMYLKQHNPSANLKTNGKNQVSWVFCWLLNC